MTGNFIQVIDDRIKQLESLKAMAADPYMLEIMRQIVYPVNGLNGTSPSQQRQQALIHEDSELGTSVSGISDHKTWSGTGVSAAAIPVMKSFNRDFTLPEVVDKMMSDGYEFTSKSPRVSVYTVAKKLVVAGELEEVGKGDPRLGSPIIYRNRK